MPIPSPSSQPFHTQGAALFLVLWALLVTSIALIVAVKLVDFDLETEAAAARRFEARQLALSGLAVASHPQIKQGNSLLHRDFGDGRQWSVRFVSENSRLNINRLLRDQNTEPLRLLFRHWGLDEQQTAILLDSLLDWTDPDNFRRLNGAEQDDIPLAGTYSRPENRPFLDLSEMERVRGMEWVVQAKPDWKDYFSLFAGRNLDLQFAPPDLIIALTGIDTQRVTQFLRMRDGEDGLPGTPDDAPLLTLQDAAALLGANPAERQALERFFQAGQPTLRRITSTGIVGKTRYLIECVVSPGEGGTGQVLSWREF